uniref:Uncharacterized protein n=1 Tax=Oryza punctata TaxID=4537 RepID=A0A0E0KFW7_ORYPU
MDRALICFISFFQVLKNPIDLGEIAVGLEIGGGAASVGRRTPPQPGSCFHRLPLQPQPPSYLSIPSSFTRDHMCDIAAAARIPAILSHLSKNERGLRVSQKLGDEISDERYDESSLNDTSMS